MFDIGEKIIYGENGVCTVERIAPLEMSGASKEKLYYYLTPLVGSGTYFAPVDTNAFMRPIISRDEADALIDSMPGIAPRSATTAASIMWTHSIASSSSSTPMKRWSP